MILPNRSITNSSRRKRATPAEIDFHQVDENSNESIHKGTSDIDMQTRKHHYFFHQTILTIVAFHTVSFSNVKLINTINQYHLISIKLQALQ